MAQTCKSLHPHVRPGLRPQLVFLFYLFIIFFKYPPLKGYLFCLLFEREEGERAVVCSSNVTGLAGPA